MNSEPQDDDERDTNMPPVDPQLAGAELRRLRESALITPDMRGYIHDARMYGLTLEEVATISKGSVSKATLSKLERGETDAPSAKALAALGRIYHMTPNDMAQLYGYWEPVVETSREDSRVIRFLRQVDYYRSKGSYKADVLLGSLDAQIHMAEGLPD